MALALGVVVLSGAGVARAEPARAPRVVDIPTVRISGRIQTPLASVEISRVEPKLALSELGPTFTDRIGKAIARAPY